ncbi:MAG: hypothetical protein H6748_21375 [Spirochaetaceae bacterium]|nr:hypothetical protein [Myxococcales bacterium]MCB9726611.1 hypothetical protein [Spirochaetaceae bacterium]HPG25847.1 hypothetical protein [Myxococcota bacterium]
MSEPTTPTSASSPSTRSTFQRVLGIALLALGLAVFLVRLQHDGAYAMPGGGNLVGGLGALVLGGLLVLVAKPRALVVAAMVVSPVVVYLALYATMAEMEEVISLYATESRGRPAELRLWIIDREDGAWVGMPRAKALEHALDGARVEMLRGGERSCVRPALFDEDRETVRAIHVRKVGKYAVARLAGAIGLYPLEAGEGSVALRLDPCPSR